ncbi:hypothetical protein PPYR_12650 [Photinus pyralis]|uniref:DDE Tnp4 domain-containing protein n=2 Tax=Photinus pyralis TaxID=7054 RepID=A0A5N4A6S0_PHOPY|nr:hypothetical protein PPYR_12650 [Photinus pyralis]
MELAEGLVMAISLAKDLFFDDSYEESANKVLPKVEGFAEDIVPRFSGRQFQQHFRITVTTFEDLIIKISAIHVSEIRVGHPEMAIDKQLLITIWSLSNLESFRSVADRFGISKSTCWDVLYRTCKMLLQANERYKIITWPNAARSLIISEHFRQLNGFPGIIGAIDGTHIRILKPKDNPNSYCNRKHYHSVLLQGVCDHQKLFTDVYAGEPGSIHDLRLFRKSDLCQRITTGEVTFPNDTHLVGDLAYSLSRYLIVGFKNIGVLTARQKNFNYKLSQCRVVMENAFGYLKGRFRRLKSLETVRLDLISLLIVSGCILHR